MFFNQNALDADKPSWFSILMCFTDLKTGSLCASDQGLQVTLSELHPL